jgi:hypothetical protein
VIADGQRLTQALIQFVSNAVRHTDDGDRIAVGSSHAGGFVSLWVDDSGTGVEPADAAHIFERFRRGVHQRRVDGAGLGLSIVQSIATAHGGTARLIDRPGPGARFTPGSAASPERTAAAHRDFLRAGAQVATTATHQASLPGSETAGHDRVCALLPPSLRMAPRSATARSTAAATA